MKETWWSSIMSAGVQMDILFIGKCISLVYNSRLSKFVGGFMANFIIIFSVFPNASVVIFAAPLINSVEKAHQ